MTMLAAFADRYAAKFAAETVYYEPPRWENPTDEAFAARFAGCVRVPASDMYPLIREAFLAEYGQLRSPSADLRAPQTANPTTEGA